MADPVPEESTYVKTYTELKEMGWTFKHVQHRATGLSSGVYFRPHAKGPNDGGLRNRDYFTDEKSMLTFVKIHCIDGHDRLGLMSESYPVLPEAVVDGVSMGVTEANRPKRRAVDNAEQERKNEVAVAEILREEEERAKRKRAKKEARRKREGALRPDAAKRH